MVAPSKGVDPRVKRTRQLLQHAFIELIQEKGIASISIQDITERATVNRATFYAHFPDKYALMDSILREQFQQRASSMLPSKPQWSLGCLRILIRAVFDFLKEFHHDCKPGDTQFDPMFERAVQQELHTILAGWLMQASLSEKKRRIPVDTVADVLSWAMFGTAVTWSRDGQTPSAEEMTRHVLLILTEGVAHLAPDLLPD
ncbi:MAG TPA: TetR/AcrR family transcriptional regulator [Ktedonobacteraceae bacterium]|nr:TetR/AcrR family transcriptional regulator [Ktedonobacteraceae bacterium]